VQDAGLPSLLCTLHQLQRTVLLGLKPVEAICGLLRKIKVAVRGFKQSNVQASYLKRAQEQCGAPQHALIQSNQTRCDHVW
jgi:hypothetical protein